MGRYGLASKTFLIGWRQVAACFVMVSSMSMITASYGVIAVPLMQEFSPSRMVLMLAITVLSAVTAVLAPVLGTLMDRFALRGLMLTGSVLLAVGYAALSFVTSFTQVLVIFGAVLAPVNVLIGPVAATVLLSRWFSKRRGTAIGIALAGTAMGGIAFPPLIQFLLDGYEWREALRIFSIVMLVLVVPAALLVVNSPEDRWLNPDGAETDPERAEGKPKPAGASVATILADPVFWIIGLLFAVTLAGMKGVVTNIAPLAIDEGIAASAAALLISLYSGSSFVAKLSFAAFSDLVKLRVLALIAFAGFAAGMFVLSQASLGFPVIAAGTALAGFFGGMMVPLKSLLAPRIFGVGAVGRAMGLLSTVTLCASLTTPPLFGLMFDLTGSYSTICLIFAGLTAAALLAIPFVRMEPRAAVAG